MQGPEFPFTIDYRARYTPNKEAVYEVSTGKRYTYGDLQERSDKLAYFLIRVRNIKKGERVGFVCMNNIALIDAYFAGNRTGIIITTYNGLMGICNIRHLIKKECPRILFYSTHFSKEILQLRQEFTDIEYICVNSSKENGEEYTYEDIMEIVPQEGWTCSRPKIYDISMLIHTGGTTGIPKAAMISYRSMFYNHITDILDLGLSAKDVGLVMLPMHHTACLNVILLPLLMCGGRIVLMESFNPSTTLKMIAQERPTVMIGVPTVYLHLAGHKEFYHTDFSCFRLMISGAAPITRDILEIYWSRNLFLTNGYGMTEIGPNKLIPPVCDMTIDDLKKRWNSAGRVMSFNNLRIVDPDGNDVAPGEKGELIWKDPLCFEGYWNNYEETEKIMENDWVHSGDIGYCDSDGYIYICDRIKNMYISGGENIFPLEVETILSQHPQIKECCIIGVPDPVWDEVGKMLIVLKDSTSEDVLEDIKRFVRQTLPKIKQPKYYKFVDKIPVNSVGKRNMQAIKKMYGNAE